MRAPGAAPGLGAGASNRRGNSNRGEVIERDLSVELSRGIFITSLNLCYPCEWPRPQRVVSVMQRFRGRTANVHSQGCVGRYVKTYYEVFSGCLQEIMTALVCVCVCVCDNT